MKRIQYKSSTTTGELKMRSAQNESRQPFRATAFIGSGEDRIL